MNVTFLLKERTFSFDGFDNDFWTLQKTNCSVDLENTRRNDDFLVRPPTRSDRILMGTIVASAIPILFLSEIRNKSTETP